MTQTTPGGTPIFHADHDLTQDHLKHIDTMLDGWDGTFNIWHETLPKGLPSLMTGLYGPACGDEPVPEDDVVYLVRGDRAGPSRQVARPARPTRMLVVIAGPGPSGPTIYTTYGSQTVAPREWWDPAMKPAEAKASAEFWMEHALAHVAPITQEVSP